jgi:hypothetical protein
MDIITTIVGGALGLLLVYFVLQLFFTVFNNLATGQKFHHSLAEKFDHLRLSKMLSALGIDKTAYIYQTNVNDIHKQMNSCSACENTDECDERLAEPDLKISEIAFCNNETELKEIKLQQEEEASKKPD